MFKLKYLVFIFMSHSLFALTTLHVSLSTDNNPGGQGDIGDLRYCLNAMNQDLNSIPDDYAIVFDFPMTIQLNGILPIINNSSNPVNITIGNTGSIPTVTIDGNSNTYPGFLTPMGNVTIQNMIFQNLSSKGGNGGEGISGGGGGMGAGGAIYVPQTFLNGLYPNVTLTNVAINNCSAVGGNGGSSLGISASGNEGGGGGGGFSGNGGSITRLGSTGGGGGGGYGGDGGNVTLSTDVDGGGGGGGGGIGSRATIGTINNLGNGGPDQYLGEAGSGYGLAIAGSGGGGFNGGINAGGGGGGGPIGELAPIGGGGGGSSNGANGLQPHGANPPPGGGNTPSGGNASDGGGGGGGGVVQTDFSNNICGQAGNGGYFGGGGGGAGTGAYEGTYTVQGGSGGVGGGGGGGGVDQSGSTSATGGSSLGGGGGAGGGPSNSGSGASGGTDIGNLGGGSGGNGANTVGSGFGGGGGGGGGGSGLGGAIFVDSNLNFTIQALSGIPTTFNTSNTTTQAGTGGSANGSGGSDGTDGLALGNSIFLRSGSSLTFMANDTDDLLTLENQVAFVDDTSFGGTGTSVSLIGNGTVVYNGTTDYQGTVRINNANFKVNGLINQAPINVCRNIGFSEQRGTLSGIGTLTGNVFVNSGVISPDTGGTLTLGNLILNPADLINNTLGSLVHTEIDSSGTSLVSVTGAASLAGTLQIDLDSSAIPGSYIILTSSGITGTFDSVTFTGPTPNYSLSYLPLGSPTFVQFNFLGFPSPIITSFNANPASIKKGESSTLTVAFTGGTGPYTATWSDGTVNNNVTSPLNHVVTPNKTTSYNVTITDNNGNHVTSNDVTVTVSPNPPPKNKIKITSFTANPNIITQCESSTLTAVFKGGTPPYKASWSDGFVMNNATSPLNHVVSPDKTTSYNVTITDKNNNKVTSKNVQVVVKDKMIGDVFTISLLQKYGS